MRKAQRGKGRIDDQPRIRQLNIRISEKDYQNLKAKAESEGKSMAQFVIDLLRNDG